MTSVHIHGFGPNGEMSPGAEAALVAWTGPGGGGASALNDLTDVDTTGQTTGDVLKYNGTSWVADTETAGGTGYPVQNVTLTDTATVTTTAWPTSQTVTVVYIQDGTGGHTLSQGSTVMADGVTWAPSIIEGSETVTVWRYSTVQSAWVCEGCWVSYEPAEGADVTAPTWSATLTTGDPSASDVVVTATALATDDDIVAGYEVSVDSGSTWTDITPAGLDFTITGLTPGSTYPAPQLRAYDAAGNRSTALSAQGFTTDSPAASLEAAILSLSPVGYWKLNETSGTTFADSSGNGRTVTVGGTAPQFAIHTGADGGSYPNWQSGASAATAADHDDFSINTTGGLTVIFFKRSGSAADANERDAVAKSNEYVVKVRHHATSGSATSRLIVPNFQNAQAETASPLLLVADEWTMHAVKYPNTTVGGRHSYYVNGVLQSTTQGTVVGSGTYTNSANPFAIGSSDVRGIAHVAVFPSALSDADVAYIADAARAEGWIA